ncbi:MAG: hypothetical protein IIZ17_03540 [Eubacteriaceae bacterium]|nr:hypothetical protein [Eubacteriaceae bacterium]
MGTTIYLTDEGIVSPPEEKMHTEEGGLMLLVKKEPEKLDGGDVGAIRAALALGFEVVYDGADEELMCPCCGAYAFSERNSYEICPVCGWEDDPLQRRDGTLSGGANEMCLADAREEFRRSLDE